MLIYSCTPVQGWKSGNQTSKNYTSLLFRYSYPEAYRGTHLVLETSAGFNKPNTDVLFHTNEGVYMFKSGQI